MKTDQVVSTNEIDFVLKASPAALVEIHLSTGVSKNLYVSLCGC